jgi:hypothetical protein
MAAGDNHEEAIEGKTLYFGYGSNLSSTQMANRCPYSPAVGLGFLPAQHEPDHSGLWAWKWIINTRGYANVVKYQLSSEEVASMKDDNGDGAAIEEAARHRPGVYGVVYLLDPADEDALDRYEGVPISYEKLELEIEIERKTSGTGTSKKRIKALVYVDVKRTEPGPPRHEYVARMNRGIREATREWRLPQWYVDQVMREYIPASEEEDVDERPQFNPVSSDTAVARATDPASYNLGDSHQENPVM